MGFVFERKLLVYNGYCDVKTKKIGLGSILKKPLRQKFGIVEMINLVDVWVSLTGLMGVIKCSSAVIISLQRGEVREGSSSRNNFLKTKAKDLLLSHICATVCGYLQGT